MKISNNIAEENWTLSIQNNLAATYSRQQHAVLPAAITWVIG